MAFPRSPDRAVRNRVVTNTVALNVVTWSALDLLHHMDQLLDIYATAMGYHRNIMEWRRGHIGAHAHRPGFHGVATFAGDRLMGFSYGHQGQWWHEQVGAAIDPTGYATWLADCFEVVELHVHPDIQGAGIGARQLTALLHEVAARTVVLSTPEQPPGEIPSRAWRLYRRHGFVDVVRDLRFPGDERPFAVLGRTLPLE
jgi:GNAT superfamily N-acetyltransferase